MLNSMIIIIGNISINLEIRQL